MADDHVDGARGIPAAQLVDDGIGQTARSVEPCSRSCRPSVRSAAVVDQLAPSGYALSQMTSEDAAALAVESAAWSSSRMWA
jgi:hypothetical protein